MTRLEGLYAITPDSDDSEWLIEQVSNVLPHGVRLLQYRNKSGDTVRRLWQANLLASLCRSQDVAFIINDDIELALAVGADGVHVGRTDAAVAEARARLGPGAIVGASCYNDLQLAENAVAAGASYIAFGAVFPSQTKPDACAAPLTLFAAAKPLGVPSVAIGGITADNAPQVVTAGADMLAVIGGLFDTADPAASASVLAGLYPAA